MARVQGMQYFSAHYIGAVSCILFASAGMGGPYKSGCLFLRILAMAISFSKHAEVWRYERRVASYIVNIAAWEMG